MADVPVKGSKIPRRKAISRVFAAEAACDAFVELARKQGIDAFKRKVTKVAKPEPGYGIE